MPAMSWNIPNKYVKKKNEPMKQPKKLAFFDMDGTLVAPRFWTGDRMVYTFPKQEWIDYCNDKKEAAYAHCEIVRPVMEYLESIKAEYTPCILTVTCSHGEELAKTDFIQWHRELNGIEHVYFVHSDDEKFDVIKARIEELSLSPADIMLVEDNLYSVMKANELGYTGIHISHIITGYRPRIAS